MIDSLTTHSNVKEGYTLRRERIWLTFIKTNSMNALICILPS